jgi:hypothetical protein
MRQRSVTLPEIALIAATRGMLGFGAGLLISERLSRNRRENVGWTLLAIGALSTIPLAIRVFRKGGNHHRTEGTDGRRESFAAVMAD